MRAIKEVRAELSDEDQQKRFAKEWYDTNNNVKNVADPKHIRRDAVSGFYNILLSSTGIYAEHYMGVDPDIWEWTFEGTISEPFMQNGIPYEVWEIDTFVPGSFLNSLNFRKLRF